MKSCKKSGNGMKSMKPLEKFSGTKEKAPAKGMPRTGDMRKKSQKP